jgi:integrase
MSDVPGVFRYCTCRDEHGKQLGKRCPDLAQDGKHGMWAWKADGARVNGKRKEVQRRGFPTQRKAREARANFLAGQGLGIKFDDKESTGDYLLANLTAKKRTLKPTTWHMYSEYVNKTLIPAIGSVRLQSLRHEHVQRMIDELIIAGRGATTVRRIVATLSSALSDGVRERRLTHNVAEHVRLPKVERSEPAVWDAAQTVQFLAAVADDPLADLFEVLIGTGLRRGECLALRWPFVDITSRTLVVDPSAARSRTWRAGWSSPRRRRPARRPASDCRHVWSPR